MKPRDRLGNLQPLSREMCSGSRRVGGREVCVCQMGGHVPLKPSLALGDGHPGGRWVSGRPQELGPER